MALFKLDPGLAIWTWIIFGILLFLLQRYIFPSLIKSLKNREDKIARSVDNAAQIEERLATIEKEHEETIRRSRAEADEILRLTREEAEAVRKKLLEKAEQEAREVLDQAKLKIEAERAAAVESIRRELAEFVCDTSEKIIGKSFTSRKDHEWAKELARVI